MQFGPFGLPEILVVLALVLIVFGPRRLPEMGRTIGRVLTEFRKGTQELKRTLDADLREIEESVREEGSPARHEPYVYPPAVPAGPDRPADRPAGPEKPAGGKEPPRP